MNKILVIKKCDDCCFFDNEYYGYNATCRQLDRKIPTDDNCDHAIPDDCPLDNYNEE